MSTLIDLTPASAGSAAGPARQGTRPAPSRPRRSAERTVQLSPTFRPAFIPDVETQAEWDLHLQGVREYYAPVGYMEDACAFRIASLLWRLNRLSRSEVDHLSHSVGAAGFDAATSIATIAAEPPHIKPILPPDVVGLRRCAKTAQLGAEVLAQFHTLPNHDPIPDEHATAAHYFLAAYYSHSRDNAPPDAAPAGWDGTRLRVALTKLAVNRSVYDDLPGAIQFAKDVAAAAEARLARIEALTAQFRRERLVPQSPLAAHIRESEASLSLQLNQAIEQLDLLQTRGAA